MKMQNNYILLQKESSKSKSTDEIDEKGNHMIRLNLPIRLRSLLNSAFNIEPNEWKEQSELFRHIVSFQLPMNKHKIDVILEVFDVQSSSYLNIEVNGNTKMQCTKALEAINSQLFNTANRIEEHYIIITAYDAVSEFYCNKIFSKFAHFERLFRRLLFNIYILNYGKEYYEKTIHKEVSDKTKRNIRARKYKEEQYLKEFFYALDYSDLQAILFTQMWTRVDEMERDNFLSNHNNLSLISDEELRDFTRNIGVKSDWERLFKDKITLASIEDDINFIRVQRNKVAHSKLFTHIDYTQSLEVLNKLLKAVNEAINLTQDKDFLEKNVESFEAGIQNMSQTLGQFTSLLAESLTPLTQFQTQLWDLFKPLDELI